RAYHCYLSPAELEHMRETAKAEGRPQVIESPWRERSSTEAPAGVKPSLRLKSRRDGETVVQDRVQGRVVVPNKDLDDLIILRSDGAPTYNFAVVVDDHDMAVTHVIRGVDHLTNTARQTQVYQAFGWALPTFAHIPLVHGSDGAKLSKRHGAQGVSEYRDMGYLPAALRNYLVRLGWSHGNDEIFSTEQAIAWFDVADVGKSPARFDFAKLGDLNSHYIRQSNPAELVTHIRAMLPSVPNGEALAARFAVVGWDRLEAALPSLQERAKTLRELIDGAAYLVAERPLPLDAKATALLDADARATLTAIAEAIGPVSDWSPGPLEAAVRALAETRGLKLGQVAQPLRAALTGRAVSPPVFDVMAVLGRTETLARIEDQIPR
ncbi:MAG: glutamate--tRNA ligase, partial [Hyphomicrobium sp.]|nr:glutamate--tRNA ligase [Hyphomicrobium sp.]